MTFPNIYVAEGESSVVIPAHYFVGGEQMTFAVTIQNTEVATCTQKDGKLIFEGKKSGVTGATLTAGGSTHSFTITVREGANGNGWL